MMAIAERSGFPIDGNSLSELTQHFFRITIFAPVDVEGPKSYLMHIDIRTHGLALADGLRERIERRDAAAGLVIETDSKECPWNG
jgi:hypothetical protein